MMLWAQFYWVSVGMALICAAPRIASAQHEVPDGPSQREVALDPIATHHPVTVVGGFGVGTNIQFPDSFEEKNVLCGGQCIVVKPGDGAAVAADPALEKDPRNWVMEIVPGARVISLRPKNLPGTITNPKDGFITNVFVKLDGGHVINLTVRLLSLRDGESHPDGLVILQLPQAQTLDGKLKSEKDKLEREYDDRLRREVGRQLAKNLGEGVRCRKIDWFAKNHRQDDVSLFVRELCGTQGAAKFFWVVFDVRNRGDRSVHLQMARLEAVDDVEKPRTVTDHYFFQQDPIYFEEQARGVATAAVAPKEGAKTALVPQRWELTVLTKSGVTLKADNLVF